MIAKEKFINNLKELFNDAVCELNFNSNFELLIAVILSAQCTDKRVNSVTNLLFKKYNTPQDFSKLRQEDLEKEIYSCGFYRNKAKNIISASKDICIKYNGQVPSDYNELLSLAGVGRKTANVVFSNAFDGNVIAVDTHVLRVSNRLGFTKSKNPDVCEKDLTILFQNHLKDLHHRMVLFGRYYCKAKNPECTVCAFREECYYYNKLKYAVKK